MTADKLSGNKDLRTVDNEVDLNIYRKIIRNFIDLRRYQTALFWAEKVVQLSQDDPNDVYWLAQCMFLSKEFHRAAYVIKNRGLEKSNIMCHYLFVESLLEAKEFQEALEILNSVNAEDLANKSWTNINESEELDEYLKYEVLASINLLKGKVLDAIDNRTLAIDFYVQALQKSVYCTEALDALVQHEMLMAWEEKDLLEHLPINQQCSKAEAELLRTLYESKLKKYYSSVNAQKNPEQTPIGNFGGSFTTPLNNLLQSDNSMKYLKPDNLNSSRLLTPTMQKIMSPANKILNSLRSTPTYSLHSSLLKSGECNKNLDSSSVIKIKPIKMHTTNFMSIELCNERILKSVDLIVARAEKYFYNYEYKKCMKLLDEALKSDPYHSKLLTVQIGCLVELKEFNKLFYVAHKLVDLYPDQAISWYAVGCYYDLIGKSDPARRYLSKASSLDRLFGPAWLAYGHSFARENEHDQAMAAYFKATQLMRGCHLPLLYIGVECGLTKNRDLAEQFFYQAMAIAPLDVFVLHELGVIKFEYNEYKDAEEVFRTTLEMVKNLSQNNNESISIRWEPLLNNLGHCCRKNKKYNEALDFHRRALILKPQSAPTYTAIGFVQALMGNLDDAIDSLHKSLSLKRDDVFATTLLKYTIEDLMEQSELPDTITNDKNNADANDELSIKEFSMDLNNSEAPVKLNCVKLKFDDFENDDTNNSQSDMSMDV